MFNNTTLTVSKQHTD